MNKRTFFNSILGKAILTGTLLFLGMGLATAHAAPAGVWYVNAAFNDATCSATHFCQTVQAAVTGATAGDTVIVTPGTYTEQVEITKNLTLTGAVGGGSIVKAPATLATKFVTPGPNNNKPVIYANNATVNIQYLTVDGDGKGNANYRIQGIGYYNAGGTIDHNTILRVRDTPANGNQHGVGLYVYNDDATARSVTVTNNTINDFQKNGMSIIGANLTASVSNNTVTGLGAINYIAQNGIQLSGGATGTVGPNNVISNISFTPASAYAAGVLLFADGIVQGNTITDVQAGVYLYDGDSIISGNTITASQANVGTTYFSGIVVVDPPFTPPSPFDPDIVPAEEQSSFGTFSESLIGSRLIRVQDNSVTATGSISANAYGIEAYAGYVGSETVDLIIKGNTVSGWGNGVVASQCTTGCTASTFSAVYITNNIIQGNTIGLDADTTVDATRNWWGSAAGPGAGGNNGIGGGGGTITTTPFAIAQTTSTTASVHELTETGTLQTNVTANDLYGAQLRVSHDTSVLNFANGVTHDVQNFFWDVVPENFIVVTAPDGRRVSGSMSAGSGHPTGVNVTAANIATWNYTCSSVGSSTLNYDTDGGLSSYLANTSGEIPSAFTGDSITCTARTGSANGTIDLQGRTQNAVSPKGWNGSIVTLTCVGGSGCDGYGPYTFYTGIDGAYTLTKAGAGTGVVAGTYNASAARRAYLLATKSGIVVTKDGTVTLTTPRLKGGDINNDGLVDILDLTAVGGAFGTTPTADTGADINGDGVVNIFDLTLTGGNFGATATWP